MEKRVSCSRVSRSNCFGKKWVAYSFQVKYDDSIIFRGEGESLLTSSLSIEFFIRESVSWSQFQRSNYSVKNKFLFRFKTSMTIAIFVGGSNRFKSSLTIEFFNEGRGWVVVSLSDCFGKKDFLFRFKSSMTNEIFWQSERISFESSLTIEFFYQSEREIIEFRFSDWIIQVRKSLSFISI